MHPALQKLFAWIQYPLPHHLLSRLVGYLARSEIHWIKTTFIRVFIRLFNVDMREAAQPDPDRYPHFNAFFTRALKEDARPLDTDPDALLCPADGTLSQLGRIRDSELIQAKGRHYSLFELLGDDILADRFRDGHFATVYLSPRDYHRVHMPLTGTLQEWLYVPGRLFSVNEATANEVPGLFARNERCVCLFETGQGPVAVILVGAMIVAGIETVFAGPITPLPSGVQRHAAGTDAITLQRGDELGRFYLGSTVIVLTAKDRVQWRAELGPGDTLRMGEKLGTLA
jgi:phosphatidylserine decarboxylase